MLKNKVALIALCTASLANNCYSMQLLENLAEAHIENDIISQYNEIAITNYIRYLQEEGRIRRQDLQTEILELFSEIREMDNNDPLKPVRIRLLNTLEKQMERSLIMDKIYQTTLTEDN